MFARCQQAYQIEMCAHTFSSSKPNKHTVEFTSIYGVSPIVFVEWLDFSEVSALCFGIVWVVFFSVIYFATAHNQDPNRDPNEQLIFKFSQIVCLVLLLFVEFLMVFGILTRRETIANNIDNKAHTM